MLLLNRENLKWTLQSEQDLARWGGQEILSRGNGLIKIQRCKCSCKVWRRVTKSGWNLEKLQPWIPLLAIWQAKYTSDPLLKTIINNGCFYLLKYIHRRAWKEIRKIQMKNLMKLRTLQGFSPWRHLHCAMQDSLSRLNGAHGIQGKSNIQPEGESIIYAPPSSFKLGLQRWSR